MATSRFPRWLSFHGGGSFSNHFRQECLGIGGRDAWNERRWGFWLRRMRELLGMEVAIRRPQRTHYHVEDTGERGSEERAGQPKQLRANEQSSQHEKRVDVHRATGNTRDQDLPFDDT